MTLQHTQADARQPPRMPAAGGSGQGQGQGRERRRSSIKSALSSLLGGGDTPGSSNGGTAGTPSPVKRRATAPKHSTGTVSPGKSHSPGKSGRRHSTNSRPSASHAGSVTTASSDKRSPDKHSSDTHSPGKHSPDTHSFLLNYLRNRGFTSRKLVVHKRGSPFKLHIAATGDALFLPTVSSSDDEYLARLNGMRPEESEEYLSDGESAEHLNQDNADQPSLDSPTHESLGQSLDSGEPPLETPHGIDTENNTRVPYNMALILTTDKELRFADIAVELSAKVKVFWNNGVPPTRSFNEEFYDAGSLAWVLSPANYNLFIPHSVSPSSQIIENNINNIEARLFKCTTPAQQRNYIDKQRTKLAFMQAVSPESSHKFKAGTYVFIVPVVFANHIPESIYFPSARVNYKFKVGSRLLTPGNEAQGDSPPRTLSNGSGSSSSTSSSSTSLSTLASSSSMRDTEAESTVPHKKRGDHSIFKKMKNSLHIASGATQQQQQHHSGRPGVEVYAEYPLRVVRTPPPISVSTANKPIYINRVWTDSLSYEISFQQKYVSLDNEYRFKIKLAPLAKNISIKRIRVSINEKITFVSKNLEFEYDQIDLVAKDPYNPYYLDFQSKRRKERNLPLLEVRTKDKGSRALREEIVENSISDNLLSYSTFDDDDDDEEAHSPKKKKKEPRGITEEISIDTKLRFPKFEDLDRQKAKIIAPYGIDIFNTEINPETHDAEGNTLDLSSGPGSSGDMHKSSVIGFIANHNPITGNMAKSGKNKEHKRKPVVDPRYHLTKIKTSSGMDVESHTRLNKPKRGLYLDSLHFSNIHASHKLEVMLRISKPDPMDPKKMRHYEVLIDTPIVVVSELCNTGNMELPTYNMAVRNKHSRRSNPTPFVGDFDASQAPPTFEEAISIPGSPLGSPVGSPMGSPMGSPVISPVGSPLVSPIGSPDIIPSYDSDLYSIQQINLSRGTTIRRPPSVSSENKSVKQQATASGTSAPNDTHFSNIDKLLTSPASNTTATFSPVTSSSTATMKPAEDSPLFKQDYTLKPGKGPSNPPEYDEIMK